MGDKMDDDEPTRGGDKDALLSAAGKRDRPKDLIRDSFHAPSPGQQRIR